MKGRDMTATTDSGDGAVATAQPRSAGSLTERAEHTAARAVQHLLAGQDAAGWWKGDLETNVTMDAEDLLLREFLGVRDERTTREAARFVRSQQRADGTWATFHGG